MAASISLLEVRILIFRIAIIFYFDRFFVKLCGLIKTCVADSRTLNVAVPYKFK